MAEVSTTLTGSFIGGLLATPAGDWIAIFVAVLAIIISVAVGYWFSAGRVHNQERKRQDKALRMLEAVSYKDTMPFAARDIESYLDAVGLTLQTLRRIPDQRKVGIGEKLRKLILRLRVTHSTLVRNMEFLAAERIDGDFGEELQKAQSQLRPLLMSDEALSEARTHCHDVRAAAWEFQQGLEAEDKANPELPPIPAEVQDALRRLGYAMERADEDTILPGMQLLLASAWQNLEDISTLLNAGEEKAARMLRLLSRQRLTKLNSRLNETLHQMDDMARFLDSAPAVSDQLPPG